MFCILNILILNASAQNVQVDKFGFQNKPLIFKISEDYPENTKVDWEFGDNNKETGREVIYRYNNLGNYTVKTKIQSKNFKEEINSEIKIIEKSAIFINNISDKQFKALNKFANINDFHLENLSNSNVRSSALKNLEIKSKIDNLKLDNFNYIIVWSNNANDLDFIYALDNEKKEKLKEKNLIFITEDISNVYLQRKVDNLKFKNALISGKEIIYDLIEIKKYDSFLKYITQREYNFINLDKDLILKKPYLVFTLLTDSLIDSGLNPEILYIILLLPILFGFMSIANNIIGIRFLNKFSLVTFVIGSIVGSIEIMLLFYLIAVIQALSNKVTIDKLNLLKIPKENFNLGLYITISLISLFCLKYFKFIDGNQINSFAMSLIIGSFGIIHVFRQISQRKLLKNLKIIFINLVSWIVIAIYFGGNNMILTNNTEIKEKILSNPEIILIFILINILAMIYSGLRVTEYITYKKIYENLEE